jgi:hypothetical protein
VRIVLDGKRIAGRAFDAAGCALAGRVLALRRTDGELVMDIDVITSARGAWSLAGIPAGPYVFELRDGTGGAPAESSNPFMIETSGTFHDVRFPD